MYQTGQMQDRTSTDKKRKESKGEAEQKVNEKKLL